MKMIAIVKRVFNGLRRRVKAFGLRPLVEEMEDSLARIEGDQISLTHRLAELTTISQHNYLKIAKSLELQGENFRRQDSIRAFDQDNIRVLKEKLHSVRLTKAYDATFLQTEPLISVRIPSYKKTEELIERAIASVLRQTYSRYEIIVVNDGPNPQTRDAIAKLCDTRIKFLEFPYQNVYPVNLHERWMVAGSPGMNRGANAASGAWIAPLDDDDEFSDDHLEKLIGLALEQRAELAYGALVQKHLTHGVENLIWSSPPAISQFSLMSAIYMKQLNFFQYDEQSWKVGEPADWNLIRRMNESGVRMAAVKDVVGTMYSISHTHKD